MFAVYLSSSHSADPVVAYLGLILALAVVGAIGAWTSPRRVRLVVALVVAFVLAGAGVALAIPYHYCDPIWKWLGIC